MRDVRTLGLPWGASIIVQDMDERDPHMMLPLLSLTELVVFSTLMDPSFFRVLTVAHHFQMATIATIPDFLYRDVSDALPREQLSNTSNTGAFRGKLSVLSQKRSARDACLQQMSSIRAVRMCGRSLAELKP